MKFPGMHENCVQCRALTIALIVAMATIAYGLIGLYMLGEGSPWK